MPTGYPSCVENVIRPNKKYKADTLRVVKRLARSRPWRGTVEQRMEKFRRALRGLSEVYGIPCPTLVFERMFGPGPLSNGWYMALTNTMGLEGKLSVVTFLHEFAHALGKNERKACVWSINLFRRCFPRSFARAEFRGHMILAGPQEEN
jgi:hypothetical protein